MSPAPAESIRLLTRQDIPDVVAMSSAVGWNQTAQDWATLIQLAPHSCFAIDVDNKPVATATLVCYGTRLAWIGMVLTKPEYQGRGFARRLLTHILAYAGANKVETIKLDATDQGAPVYEKLGFRAEQIVERWFLPAPKALHEKRVPASENGDWRAIDLEAFGADRSALLGHLAQRRPPLRESGSFLLSRDGREASYLGPCVARDRSDGRVLIENCLRQNAVAWFWDLLPANPEAMSLATDLGFTSRRRLTRMFRGTPHRGRDDRIFAIAGFEFG